MVNIKKGLDLPISGSPEQKISDTKIVSKVAVIGFDKPWFFNDRARN